MPDIGQETFLSRFEGLLAWKLCTVHHLSEDGAVNTLQIIPGRAKTGSHEQYGCHGRQGIDCEIPAGDYLYVQAVGLSSSDRPVLSVHMVELSGEVIWEGTDKRMALITPKEIVTFFPAGQEQHREFISQPGMRDTAGELARSLGIKLETVLPEEGN